MSDNNDRQAAMFRHPAGRQVPDTPEPLTPDDGDAKDKSKDK